jgi:L-ascorbate metabolism protein UlaG (beta-lactamase superfamily)
MDPTEINAEDFLNIDVILITHEHADHLDPKIVKNLYEKSKCLVVADDMSIQYLEKIVPEDNLKEGIIGQSFKHKDLKIHPLRTAWFVDGNVRQWNPLTYLIESEDGVKLFHSGDSPPFSKMTELGDSFCIDIVLCTIGGGNGTPRSGAQIPILMKPKVAIPYHALDGFERFCEILSVEAPNIKCKILKPGEIYQYNRSFK